MKTLREVFSRCHAQLGEAGHELAKKEAEQLICHALNIARIDLYLDMERGVQENDEKLIASLISRRLLKEPVAQIIGHVPFFGCTIEVNRDVLIPRVETEQLVEMICQELNGTENVLDLCSGSGCIGIALKKRFPNLSVTLSDLSEEALGVAKRNKEINGVDVIIRQGDFLDGIVGPFEVVVCNPPYISEEEFPSLDEDVRLFEPKKALVAPNNGLYFYKKLAKELPGILKGTLFAEIGSTQGQEVLKLFKPPWKESAVYNDLCGKERIFRAVFS